MKPLFAIELTEKKKSGEPNGEEFLVGKPSALLSQRLNETGETLNQVEKKARLPLVARILVRAFGFAVIVIWGGIIRAVAEPDVTFKGAYANAPWLIWAGAIGAALFVFLIVFDVVRRRTVLASGNAEEAIADVKRSAEAIFRELGVPETAKEINVLAFCYRVKDGEPRACAKAKLQTTLYAALNYKAYSDGENLYLVWTDGKYAFPRSELKAIRTVKRPICFLGWFKDEPPDSEAFKPYKLAADEYGVRCKRYHILEIERDGETWGIYLPSYELPAIEELTGLKAEEDALRGEAR